MCFPMLASAMPVHVMFCPAANHASFPHRLPLSACEYGERCLRVVYFLDCTFRPCIFLVSGFDFGCLHLLGLVLVSFWRSETFSHGPCVSDTFSLPQTFGTGDGIKLMAVCVGQAQQELEPGTDDLSLRIWESVFCGILDGGFVCLPGWSSSLPLFRFWRGRLDVVEEE